MLGGINADIRCGTIITSSIGITTNLHGCSDLVRTTVKYAVEADFKRTSHNIHAKSEDSGSA